MLCKHGNLITGDVVSCEILTQLRYILHEFATEGVGSRHLNMGAHHAQCTIVVLMYIQPMLRSGAEGISWWWPLFLGPEEIYGVKIRTSAEVLLSVAVEL